MFQELLKMMFPPSLGKDDSESTICLVKDDNEEQEQPVVMKPVKWIRSTLLPTRKTSTTCSPGEPKF